MQPPYLEYKLHNAVGDPKPAALPSSQLYWSNAVLKGNLTELLKEGSVCSNMECLKWNNSRLKQQRKILCNRLQICAWSLGQLQMGKLI